MKRLVAIGLSVLMLVGLSCSADAWGKGPWCVFDVPANDFPMEMSRSNCVEQGGTSFWNYYKAARYSRITEQVWCRTPKLVKGKHVQFLTRAICIQFKGKVFATKEQAEADSGSTAIVYNEW